jgi:hypothetical protein
MVLTLPLVPGWAQSQERLDLLALTRLKSEAYNNSQTMNVVSWIVDIYGPTVTGSPNMHNAANYLERQMKEFGLSNVHQETFPFGKSWEYKRFYVHELAPQSFPILGGVEAFTGGTPGWVKGEVVLFGVQEDRSKYAGKLKGKFVLLPKPPPFEMPSRPTGKLTDEQLARMAQTGPPTRRWPEENRDPAEIKKRLQEQSAEAKWFVDQGVLATIESSFIGEFGTVFVGPGRNESPDVILGVPQITIATEHYNRIVRQLGKKIPVTLEMNIEVEADNKMGAAINVVGEIPGGDKADELVILGGHYDAVAAGSGTGATDDVVGCVTALEAVRLIQASGLKPRRTIRVACWSGEEEGLLGSRAYVQAHFRDWNTGALKPEHSKLSVYFNLDNGAGAIRGVHTRGNDSIFPIFTQWMKPLNNMGVTTLTTGGGPGTDDHSFDKAGLPGFEFLQDPLDYSEHTHHSNMDTYERIPLEDTIKNSVIMAFFAWQAANRDEMMPRKPLPSTH